MQPLLQRLNDVACGARNYPGLSDPCASDDAPLLMSNWRLWRGAVCFGGRARPATEVHAGAATPPPAATGALPPSALDCRCPLEGGTEAPVGGCRCTTGGRPSSSPSLSLILVSESAPESTAAPPPPARTESGVDVGRPGPVPPLPDIRPGKRMPPAAALAEEDSIGGAGIPDLLAG